MREYLLKRGIKRMIKAEGHGEVFKCFIGRDYGE